MQSASPSVESLRDRSERSRAELKRTIGELSQTLSDTADEFKTTLSPHNLKEEMRAYAREKQANVIQAVQKNVRDHPLEALAIGALATYPLLGLLRKVPVPLALIGAGLLLARNRNGSGAELRAQRTGPPDDTDETIGEIGLGEKLRSDLEDSQHTVASAATKAKETIADMATSTITGVRSSAGEWAAQAKNAGADSKDAIAGLVYRNPLLASGLAMAIGGFIAASIPVFRIEERVLGKGGEAVRGAARKTADGVIKGAKMEVNKVADSISAAARDASLTPESLDRTVDAMADKVAAVVDRGVDAAIDPAASRETEDSSNGDGNARF